MMQLSDSDDECYEQMKDSFSPPNNMSTYDRPTSRVTTDHMDHQQRPNQHQLSIIPPDIDRRPPCPIPKNIGSTHLSPGQLSYDITVSPVTPDYEISSSASPPRLNGYGVPICNGGGNHLQQQLRDNRPPLQPPQQLRDNRPPLPPINPNRKPPSRSISESSDQLSVTPPRSMTNTLPLRSNTTAGGSRQLNDYRLIRSNSESDTSSCPTAKQGDSHNGTIRPSSGQSRNFQKLSLKAFTEKYKNELPLQVVITKGYYGPDERNSISDGDMFNVHFFKQAKTVKVQDMNKYEYAIPLNSSLEFGPVYHLPSGFKQIDSKYHFKTVSDIMHLKELPKVLRVTRSFKGSSQESSVEQNDLLIVQEIKTKKKGIKSSKVLKCVLAGTTYKKMLGEDCAGHFSVRSSDTKLFLPEIVEHVKLPIKVNMYSSSSSRLDLPLHLTQDEIEILRVEIEESIVATSIPDKNDRDRRSTSPYQNTTSTPLVDVPLDLDIEVAIMGLGDGEVSQLYAETRSLCEKYNPGEASYLNLPSSVTANAQTTLFRTIRQDHNRQVGVEIMRPLNAFRNPADLSANRLSNGSDSSRKQLCTPSECANAEEVNGRLESLEMHTNEITNRLNKFEILIQNAGHSAADHKDQKKRMTQLQEEVTQTRKETEELRKIITDIPRQFAQLTATVDTLKKTVDLLQLGSTDTHTMNGHGHVSKANMHINGTNTFNVDFEAQNRDFLQRLTYAQVSNLLTAMNLSQYVEAFKNEQISGEILSELTEDVLQQELGVASKIHRIKLMKIISGRHSAVSIINGDDPYYVHLAQSK